MLLQQCAAAAAARWGAAGQEQRHTTVNGCHLDGRAGSRIYSKLHQQLAAAVVDACHQQQPGLRYPGRKLHCAGTSGSCCLKGRRLERQPLWQQPRLPRPAQQEEPN